MCCHVHSSLTLTDAVAEMESKKEIGVSTKSFSLGAITLAKRQRLTIEHYEEHQDNRREGTFCNMMQSIYD